VAPARAASNDSGSHSHHTALGRPASSFFRRRRSEGDELASHRIASLAPWPPRSSLKRPLANSSNSAQVPFLSSVTTGLSPIDEVAAFGSVNGPFLSTCVDRSGS
jgi:hypothetical protein